MLDLKPYFDAVNAASDQVQRVAQEIDALFTEGTEESQAKALGMRSDLEAAQSKYDAAAAMYETMQKANRPNDVAKNFVPVSTTPSTVDAEKPADTMKISDFRNLSPAERMAFVKADGKVVN